MIYRTYRPASPLSDFVDLLWYYDGYQATHERERLLPDGSVEIVINLRANCTRIYDKTDHAKYTTFPGAILCGPHSEFFVIDTDEQASIMGVHFRRGGAFPFFALPAGELRNQHVALEDLWGAAANDGREMLIEAATPEARFRTLERALLRQIVKPMERHRAVGFALRQLPTATVAGVTDQIGLSSRHFIRLFSEEVGLTPKVFSRVERFQQVLRRIRKGRQPDWADIALSCGYFDQSHFIHDFRAFSGLSPTAYLAQYTDHVNHVPIPG